MKNEQQSANSLHVHTHITHTPLQHVTWCAVRRTMS